MRMHDLWLRLVAVMRHRYGAFWISNSDRDPAYLAWYAWAKRTRGFIPRY
jgi:hypothetical protein